MKEFLRLIDVDTSGSRNDVTPLFADAKGFAALVANIYSHFPREGYDLVAGIDALGFVMGAAIALRAERGFFAVRKGGKLPVETESLDFVDYTGKQKSLEIRTDILTPGTRVLLVDEWVETGAQVWTAVRLIESQEGVIAGIGSINFDESKTIQALKERYDCYQVWD
ncbi:MAG: phosphoribosyltransferase family protein [Anaerolineales bacterium]|jgi:adenine phosphoribosyltransferase